MAAIHAQIVVGLSGSYFEDGIHPTHVLWLTRGSRPGWRLMPMELSGAPVSVRPKDMDPPPWAMKEILWVPSRPEHILDDAIVMIAVHVLCDEGVIGLANELAPGLLEKDWADLTEMEDEPMLALHQACVEMKTRCMLWITLLPTAALDTCIGTLPNYPVAVEVCRSVYSRSRSYTDGSIQETGTLAPPIDT